jgi:uncharacterized protein (TIGR03437 family)
LYGTGWRNHSSPVTCTIGGQAMNVLGAVAQGAPGLDQMNVELPLSLRGAGDVTVQVTVDGTPTNAVQIRMQ